MSMGMGGSIILRVEGGYLIYKRAQARVSITAVSLISTNGFIMQVQAGLLCTKGNTGDPTNPSMLVVDNCGT